MLCCDPFVSSEVTPKSFATEWRNYNNIRIKKTGAVFFCHDRVFMWSADVLNLKTYNSLYSWNKRYVLSPQSSCCRWLTEQRPQFVMKGCFLKFSGSVRTELIRTIRRRRRSQRRRNTRWGESSECNISWDCRELRYRIQTYTFVRRVITDRIVGRALAKTSSLDLCCSA